MSEKLPVSPQIDRGDPVLIREGVGTSSSLLGSKGTMSATEPRVGRVISGVAWTGGSNLEAEKNAMPEDVLCFHPETFKEMQKQHESLKQGLDVEQRLELVDGAETTDGLVTWITWMMMLFINKGMDTVFRILIEDDTNELDLV